MTVPDEAAKALISLLDELARLRGRLVGAFRVVSEQQGCSELEMLVLTAVVGAVSPPTVPRIGRSLGHPRQVIQRIADDLARRGLIGFRQNPDHKRARLLVSTEAGRQLKAAADRHGLEIAGNLIAGLEAESLRATGAALHAIRERIELNLRGGNRGGAS